MASWRATHLSSRFDNQGNLNLDHGPIMYIFSCVAIHGCTCSCLTSAFIYRTLNGMHEDDAPAWAARHKWLLMLPFIKFVMGCFAYLITVIVLSYETLADEDSARYIALAIGIMSMSSVGILHLLLVRDSPKGATTK